MPPKRSDESLQEHWSWLDEHSYPDPSLEERLWLADMAPGADEHVPGIRRVSRADELEEAA